MNTAAVVEALCKALAPAVAEMDKQMEAMRSKLAEITDLVDEACGRSEPEARSEQP